MIEKINKKIICEGCKFENSHIIFCADCNNGNLYEKAEKKVDKLKEQYTIGENQKLYKKYGIKGSNHISETEQLCLVIRKLELHEQEAIEQIIKEKDQIIQYWIGQLGIVAEEKTLLLKNNKQ